MQGKFPQIARSSGVVMVFVEYAAEFEKDFVAARIFAQTVAEKLLGLSDFSHSATQPISGHGVSLDVVRIEFGGELQPGKNFAHFRIVPEVTRGGGVPLSSTFVEVCVNRGIELAAEGIYPISRISQEAVFIPLIVASCSPSIFSHVRGFKRFTVVEYRRIIAAMEVGVSLDIEMVGEDSPTIAEERWSGSPD